jgi:hypothetical protein
MLALRLLILNGAMIGGWLLPEALGMDAATLTTFLTPHLSVLIQSGQAASPGHEANWSKAQAIWVLLSPQIAARAAAQEAAVDLAKHPGDPDYAAALRVQLKKLLEQDPVLAAAITNIFAAEAGGAQPRAHISQTVSGSGNQVIGQVSGGSVVFGTVEGTVNLGGQSAAPESKPATKTILFLAANPKGTSQLRLDQELRDIGEGLQRAKHRDRFQLEQCWAARPQDLRRALLQLQPQILHFSGHGEGVAGGDSVSGESRKLAVVSSPEATSGAAVVPEGLVLEDEIGQPKLVSAEALAALFELFADTIECVVLNACYSDAQAQAIAVHVPYVVGMRRQIGDKAAIEFAVGFYDALGAGRDVEFAYRYGCNAIQLAGIPEDLTPVLRRR